MCVFTYDDRISSQITISKQPRLGASFGHCKAEWQIALRMSADLMGPSIRTDEDVVLSPGSLE